MANNVEKFVIDLGFSADDLNKLKSLLRLQQQSQKAAKVHNKQQRDAQAKELAFKRKQLQIQKLLTKAEKEGVDVGKYKRSIAATKKIATLEKTRIELDKAHFEAKTANDKKRAAAKKKELNVEKKITAEVVKQKQFNNMPPKSAFQSSQRRKEAARDQDTYNNVRVRQIELRARKAGLSEEDVRQFKRQAELAKGNRAEFAKLNQTISEYAYKQRQATMQTRKANLAMQGLNDSTRHMIRSYASLFAVLATAQSINTVGQKFEAMQSAMLAATGTSQEASQEIEFLDKMTSRLGLSLLDTSDAYTKFLFASKGKLDQSETRELFEGLSELGTTLGVSKERMKLSMNAITQMMNKGKISSEELRLQLAESLPGAIQIFARSIGKSEAELFKMMENGELLAADVLPKVAKEMKAVAAVGLESKLDTLRVAQGQFFNELEKAQKTIFDGGFSDGLKDLFQTLTAFARENQEALEGLGKVFKTVFNLIEGVVKVVVPVIATLAETFGNLHDSMTEAFGEDSIKNIGTQMSFLLLILRPVYAAAVAILGVFDEIAALFTSGKVGMLEVALGKDIDFNKANISGGEMLSSLSSPTEAFMTARKMFDSSGSSETWAKSFDRNQISNPLKVEVRMEEGLEAKINEVTTKSNGTYILSGAH